MKAKLLRHWLLMEASRVEMRLATIVVILLSCCFVAMVAQKWRPRSEDLVSCHQMQCGNVSDVPLIFLGKKIFF